MDAEVDIVAPTAGLPGLVAAARDGREQVLVRLAGQSVLFRCDDPAGTRVVEAILGPYCELSGPGPADWTVSSAPVPGLGELADRLEREWAAAGLVPRDVRRWPGDFDSHRWDLPEGRTVVVHRRPFLGLTVFSAADRELTYLRADAGFDASHTEHLVKYPLRTTLRQAGFAQLHAAAAYYRGRGFLLLGEKAAGKSTLLVQLLLRGAEQVSNDLAFAHVTPAGTLEMVAFPHITRVGDGTIGDCAPLRDGLAAEPRTGDYVRSPVFNAGKEEFYHPVLRRIWGRDPIRRRCPLDAILLPAFDLGCATATGTPLGDAERDERVRRSLLHDSPLPDWLPFLPDGELARLAAATAERVLGCRPPAYRLHYGPSRSDPAAAVDAVLDHLDAYDPHTGSGR